MRRRKLLLDRLLEPQATPFDGAEAVVDVILERVASEVRSIQGHAHDETTLARGAAVIAALVDVASLVQETIARKKEEADEGLSGTVK